MNGGQSPETSKEGNWRWD